MRRLAATALLLLAACGSDDDSDFCLPQGTVTIGAIGTAGDPLASFADCYAGSSPVLSLDSARTTTVSGNDITFVDTELTATVDSDTCRISITYTFDSMLSDNTPTMGTSNFAADPDPGDSSSWNVTPEGSIDFEWLDQMNNTDVCGNEITDVVIAVQQ